MKTSKKYTKELYRQFGYLATWLPGTPIALGDIGILRNNEFTKISTLESQGIKFDVVDDPTESDIEHSSKGGVSLTTKASGTAAPVGSALGNMDAGITVEFSKENAILFKANGTTSPSIKNQIALGAEIIKRFQTGKWDKDWAVVTEVVNAKSGTILISSSRNGKIELKATAKVDTAMLDIADTKLGLEMKFSKDLSTKIIAQEGLTPLFKVSTVKSNQKLTPAQKMSKLRTMDMVTPELAKEDANLLYFSNADLENDEEEE